MKKRIISLALACAILLSANVQVFAESVPAGCLKETPLSSLEEQLAELSAAGLNTAAQTAILEKLLDLGPSTPQITSRATTWSHLPGTYICYAQQNSSYCMPAVAKAVIQYLMGSSDSQADIAKAMKVGQTTGGSFSEMRPYLNNNQNKNSYVTRDYSTTKTTMESNFHAAITTFKAPAVLSIFVTASDDWPYTTQGHAVALNAARDDKGYFQVADPWIGYITPGANPYYQRDSNTFHTIITVDQYCGYVY
ncbi:MAG: C39 family peptidase [Oscillospiraceae bacterium]|nr:C39 family peptidase [Oscillospiraceae bacterium]